MTSDELNCIENFLEGYQNILRQQLCSVITKYEAEHADEVFSTLEVKLDEQHNIYNVKPIFKKR